MTYVFSADGHFTVPREHGNRGIVRYQKAEKRQKTVSQMALFKCNMYQDCSSRLTYSIANHFNNTWVSYFHDCWYSSISKVKECVGHKECNKGIDIVQCKKRSNKCWSIIGIWQVQTQFYIQIFSLS